MNNTAFFLPVKTLTSFSTFLLHLWRYGKLAQLPGVKIAFPSSGKKHQSVQGWLIVLSFQQIVSLIIPQGAVYFLPVSAEIFLHGNPRRNQAGCHRYGVILQNRLTLN